MLRKELSTAERVPIFALWQASWLFRLLLIQYAGGLHAISFLSVHHPPSGHVCLGDEKEDEKGSGVPDPFSLLVGIDTNSFMILYSFYLLLNLPVRGIGANSL